MKHTSTPNLVYYIKYFTNNSVLFSLQIYNEFNLIEIDKKKTAFICNPTRIIEY